ncbi:GNAT family N-acetyltransferase [Butyrivibrio fibrisolvens]|uniref:GNAT family N-acetyltransferase n=1 Tax=Butyrivibrio fibrisolvens TaxID=831 RepID=UPI00200AE668|nr:GNAT family N-acetyltransferase [Butyrivibrio fibrisolvens]
MKEFTGHVGYSVRPSERRKGYAKRMLAKALDFLKSFGFDEIGVSCIPSNEASKKTILANGGEYIETVFLECDQVDLERYRIRLN